MDKGLEEISTMLLRMGGLAKETVALSIRNFLNGKDVSEEIHSRSETLGGMSIDIEDKVFELIAKYQPVASDLRTIKSHMKIAYDLERYGRYAWDISFIQQMLTKHEKCEHFETQVEVMAEKVTEMVNTSIKVLRDYDVELAKALADSEKEVDSIYLHYLLQITKTLPATSCAVCDLLVVRYLERIADHAAYVGESVIYIVTGQKILLR